MFWIIKRRKKRVRSKLSKSSRVNYLLYKERARGLVLAKIAKFNTFYNFKLGKVAIKDTRTRWGSCSNKGNLNFNYKIFFLPEPLVDYIIVHELCHLAEFNHSHSFWVLVAQTMPDYKERQAELKKTKITVDLL